MKRTVTLALVVASCVSTAAADWTAFRGKHGNGASASEKAPTNIRDRGNIRWAADLPGRGLSSPIIIDQKIYITCSSGPEQKVLHVLCFDDATGQLIWERQFQATGRTMCHQKTCVAAPSPVSDGQRIFALFSSNDLFCLDLDGNLLWLRGLTYDYPNASNSLGMSSSPIVVDDTLVLQIENDSESFAAGLDVQTGQNRWKLDRPKVANWCSPVVIESDSQPLVALQSGNGVQIVEARTGQNVGTFSKGASTIPSSAVGDGILFVPSGGITAIKADTTADVVWQSNRLAPSTASPLVLGDNVYIINRAGVLNCASCDDGELKWQQRLRGPFSASPIGAENHIYAVNEDGVLFVVENSEDSRRGKIVSELDLEEVVLSTPALAGGAIYIRSDNHLWKIAD